MDNENQENNDLHHAISLEAEAKDQFIYHIQIAIQLAQPIHHWGDDDYGYLRELFNQELINQSNVSASPLLRALGACDSGPLYKKSKISGTKKKRVLERDKYRCINCDDHKDLCVDHITAESKGGDNSMSNLQTLCRSCNSSKGTKSMSEWLGEPQ